MMLMYFATVHSYVSFVELNCWIKKLFEKLIMNFCVKLLVGFESKNTWAAFRKAFICAPVIFPFTLLVVVANILNAKAEADFKGNPA